MKRICVFARMNSMRILLVLLVAFGAVLAAQDAWRDPSKHDVRFVTVDQDVLLELLDWGGSGPAVVLLTSPAAGTARPAGLRRDTTMRVSPKMSSR